MELRKIPYENTVVVLIIDDADNVIAAGCFETREDANEATRMTSVLLANLGLVKGISTGILPMPYKEFRKIMDALTDFGKGEKN